MSMFGYSNVKNNGRKKLLFLGVSGHGKSALCNALSRPVHINVGLLEEDFPESSRQTAANTRTILKDVDFLGCREKGITLIDTIGSDGTAMSNTTMAELIDSLKEYCDHINLFAIVISPSQLIEAPLKEIIELYVRMFGKDRFWQNAVLIFTKLQQSDEERRRRSREKNNDQQRIANFNATMRKTFNHQRHRLPTFIIDAHYDGTKSIEKSRFEDSANGLYNTLMRSGERSVKDVQRVIDSYDGLHEEVRRLQMEKVFGKVKIIASEAAAGAQAYVAGGIKFLEETGLEMMKNLEEEKPLEREKNNTLKPSVAIAAHETLGTGDDASNNRMSVMRMRTNLSLKNNGRRKLLFLGVTGDGKSALCNALSQPVKTDDELPKQDFPESSDQTMGNDQTILKNVDFLGYKSRQISLIDTVGFDSIVKSNTEVAELIFALKEYCDDIHLFAIVVSSPERIKDSLKETIELYVGMFGEKRFWENTVLIFTKLQQSDDQICRRSKANSDQQRIKKFNTVIKRTFGQERDVPTLIIDAHYDGSKKDEKTRFTDTAYELYDLLIKSAGISVAHVQQVVGRYEGLQEEMKRLEEDAKRLEKENDTMKKISIGAVGLVGVAAVLSVRSPATATTLVTALATLATKLYNDPAVNLG